MYLYKTNWNLDDILTSNFLIRQAKRPERAGRLRQVDKINQTLMTNLGLCTYFFFSFFGKREMH